MNAPAGPVEKLARPRFYPSIRTAIMLELTLALAPALAIIVSTGLEQRTRLREYARQEALRQVDAFAEIQERVTRSAEQTLLMIAALPVVRSGGDEEASAVLRAIKAVNPEHLNYTVTDARGVVVASARLASGTDLSERPHIRRALKEKRFSAGQYFLNHLDRTPTYAYSLPLFNAAGDTTGTANLGIAFDAYSAFFERQKLPEDAFLGLVDRAGIRLFFHPPKESNPLGAPIKDSVWERIRGGDEGSFIERSSDGLSRFYAYKPMRIAASEAPYMYVVYGIPDDTLQASGDSALRRNLIAMAAVALFAFVSSLLMTSRLFGKRLSAVIATTERIAGGDASARVGIERDRSDIGKIAAALDTMAETVQRRERETGEYAASLAESLREKEILLKEVHHRVKNNLQMITSFIRLQDGESGATEAFKTSLENRIASMAVVHEMLYESGDMSSVDIGAYASRLTSLVSQSMSSAVSVQIKTESAYCGLDKAVTFGLLLDELLLNSYKHAFRDGRSGVLAVSLGFADGSARLEVRDDGPGFPAGFDPSESAGLGLRLVEALAEQLGGSVFWENAAPGVRFEVVFPAQENSS